MLVKNQKPSDAILHYGVRKQLKINFDNFYTVFTWDNRADHSIASHLELKCHHVTIHRCLGKD